MNLENITVSNREQSGLYQSWELLGFEGCHQDSEKDNSHIGENTCKPSIW